MSTTCYYTIAHKGKKYQYKSPVYGINKVAHNLQISKKFISAGCTDDLPEWPPHRQTIRELWKKLHPTIVLNGPMDTVVELRKENWIARAWGLVVGQILIGAVIFYRR